ncbi:serine protease gd-like isoform X1 [Formica exsecta]|uniref:serine protease gd-like isoform X1 n=2 Tax=Formica exsecta TaxID=72781 RepID=UPI001144B3F7|nr:serine protease gd-like isoform X1 [Formica exsecta]XP_029666347.1 serine protease gd-like isoform X1 [Formica exsecta]XP_029666349.1 serine protease gd-like isoform X1 [Formica exsecta]XP_029666350.1 serine protease gd-like isoform X1 [Formica exsecta]XP_029666351.1 serine protease gd-like isoform X1 [Formica exsecta]XP_029666352.1 serine protease gd-like isoform X1 [Formica exsecta]
MAKIPILIALLPQLLCTLLEVSGQQSPCSQYFTYIIDPATNEMMGQIQIPTPPKNVELHLKVALSIAVALSTNYVGQLELAQSKEESVRIVQQGRPLLYHIHFPLRQPNPLLTGIWFNNQQYCSGPRATGHIVTSIMLEHTLYPPNVLPLSQSSDPNGSPQQNPPAPLPVYTTSRPPNRPVIIQRPTTVTLSDGISNNPFLNPPVQQNNNNECGISTHTNNINLLISKGMKTSPGQWPWLAALFIVKLKFEFQCAGSILTNKHVITAAHCFKLDAQTNIPPSAMLVSLGRYQLRDWHQAGSVNMEIASYTLHPDYIHQETGDSDLAILTLRTPVEFSPTIKPICLWYGSTDLQSAINKIGYVVGWGRDEFGNPYVAEPRMAKVPIVSQEVCLWSDSRFVSFTSNRTFCAGSRDGSGPCNGDSGSGLVLHDAATGRYQLRGIVSRSLYDRDEMTCDLTQYVVFVDVAKYLFWIQQQISTT